MALIYKTIKTSILVGLISISSTVTLSYGVESKIETVHIKADKMYFDLHANTSVYNGNVKIKQGNMELFGDRITIKQEANKIVKIVANGDPALYYQLSTDGTEVQAQSKLIQYFADKNRLVMIDQARLVQDDQIIESGRIVYDTQKQTLIAGERSKQTGDSSRVKITLTPSTKQ